MSARRRFFAALGSLLAGAASPSPELVGGIEAYNRGDPTAAARLLIVAAGRGEAQAMVDLGYLYARGQGVPRDPGRALELYRRAAASGDAEGMNAVGYRYDHAAEPDFGRAIEWYCRAMSHGNVRAMNNLAILVFNGSGVARDRVEARRLWREAAMRGSMTAQSNLANDLLSDPRSSESERSAAQATLDALGKDLRTARMELLMRLEPTRPDPVGSRVCGDLIA